MFLNYNSKAIIDLLVSALNNFRLPCTVAESVMPVKTLCTSDLGYLGPGVQYNVHVQLGGVLGV